MRKRFNICGLPESATFRRAGAAQELRRVALACPDMVARELVQEARDEHRQAVGPDLALVRDVRDRGGVCFPGGMTSEEWRNRLPRALQGKRGRCVPADEIAQEMADRGTIPEPTSDAALDHLGKVYARARSKPALPDQNVLKREARAIVRQRVTRAIRHLKHEIRRECPASEKLSEA